MIAATIAQGGRACGRVLLRCALAATGIAGIGMIASNAAIPVKAAVAQVLLERAFDRGLAQHSPVKPWRWADTAPIARITLDRLHVREIILSGGSGQAMAFGPTQLAITAPGVTIMAAHRDTHFAFLKDARVGDMVGVQGVDGQSHRYRIARFQIVRWDRFAYPRDPAHPLLGLVTCYPFEAVGHGPMRMVAWAEEVKT